MTSKEAPSAAVATPPILPKSATSSSTRASDDHDDNID